MIDLDECADVREKIIEEDKMVGLYAYNFEPLANKFQVPRRYLEVIMSWKTFGDLYDGICAERDKWT